MRSHSERSYHTPDWPQRWALMWASSFLDIEWTDWLYMERARFSEIGIQELSKLIVEVMRHRRKFCDGFLNSSACLHRGRLVQRGTFELSKQIAEVMRHRKN